MYQASTDLPRPIEIFKYRVSGSSFWSLYNEAMALIQKSAEYLDGQGKRDSQDFSPSLSLLYAEESMSLTTRLMQLASWFFILRALNSEEMKFENALSEMKKLCLDVPSSLDNATLWKDLPEKFRDLIMQSLRLQSQACRLNQEIQNSTEEKPFLNCQNNPVSHHMKLLYKAFSVQV